MASLLPTDIFVTVTPIVIIGTIYYLLVRFRRRGLSRPVHAGFLVTLATLVIWGAYLLVMVATGGGFSRLIFFDWEDYFLPVTVGSFCLAWSVVTLWDFRTRSTDVALSVSSRRWMRAQVFIAFTVVALAAMALLGYGYREYQLGVAGNNNIAPQRLRAMYHSRHASIDSEVMKRLASNTATPKDVLQQLARHDDNSIRRNVCNNPATPLSLLSVLAKDESWSVRRSVCDNPATPLSLLSGLVTDENWGVRLCVAEHPNVSVAILAQLASDQSMNVRQNVAQNPAAPPEAQLKLSHDSSHYVRTFVAMNKATPAMALAILATDKQQSVRHLVARHPALSLKQQLLLAADSSATVRRVVLSRPDVSRDVLAKLENDPDENIRRLVRERYSYYRKLDKQAGKRH